MATGSNDVEEIFNRMAVIRRELHTNVRESVAGAEAVVDWGRYTWTYPWIALGAAAAVGFLVYTSGHQKVTARERKPGGRGPAGEPAGGTTTKVRERLRTGQNLLLGAWGIVFPVAVRAGQNYMLNWLEQQYSIRTRDGIALAPAAEERGGWMGRADR